MRTATEKAVGYRVVDLLQKDMVILTTKKLFCGFVDFLQKTHGDFVKKKQKHRLVGGRFLHIQKWCSEADKADGLQDIANPEMRFSRFFTALMYHGPPEASFFFFQNLRHLPGVIFSWCFDPFCFFFNQDGFPLWLLEATLSRLVRLDGMDPGTTLKFSIHGGKCLRREERLPRKTMVALTCRHTAQMPGSC